MNNLYVYYVIVDFARPHESYITGIRNRINLVIAEDESSAVKLMQDKVKPYSGTASLPDFSSGTLSANDVGHGMEITAFLEQGSDEIDAEKIISYYSSKVDCELQLWDENGEVKMLNTFNHGNYVADAPVVPKNVFVQLNASQEDTFESGVALLANQADNQEEEALVRVLGGDILLAESTSDVKSNDYAVKSIRQVKLNTDGAILVREKAENSNVFTEWKLTPVFAEEAPHDGHQYVRFNSHWVPITIEGTDIYEDDIDAFLNGTAHIIENSGILVARTVDSDDINRDVNQVLISNDGEIYTRKAKQTLADGVWSPDMDGVEWTRTFYEIDARFDRAEARIKANENDIDKLEGRMSTAESNIRKNTTDISNNAKNITANQKSIQQLSKDHVDFETETSNDILNLDTKIQQEIDSRSNAISDLIAAYKSADKATLENSKKYTDEQISKADSNVNETISSLEARIESLENKIKELEEIINN